MTSIRFLGISSGGSGRLGARRSFWDMIGWTPSGTGQWTSTCGSNKDMAFSVAPVLSKHPPYNFQKSENNTFPTKQITVQFDGALPILLLVWHRFRLYIVICEGWRLQIYSRCHIKRRIGGSWPCGMTMNRLAVGSVWQSMYFLRCKTGDMAEANDNALEAYGSGDGWPTRWCTT